MAYLKSYNVEPHTEENHEMFIVVGLLRGRKTRGTAGATASGLSPEGAKKHRSFPFTNSARRHVSKSIYACWPPSGLVSKHSRHEEHMSVKHGQVWVKNTNRHWHLLGKGN